MDNYNTSVDQIEKMVAQPQADQQMAEQPVPVVDVNSSASNNQATASQGADGQSEVINTGLTPNQAMAAVQHYAPWDELRAKFLADKAEQQADMGYENLHLRCFDKHILPKFAYGKKDLRQLTVDQAKENMRAKMKNGYVTEEMRAPEVAKQKAFLEEYWAQHPTILAEMLAPRARPARARQQMQRGTVSASKTGPSATQNPGSALEANMAVVGKWAKTQTYLSRRDMHLALKWAFALSNKNRQAKADAGHLPVITNSAL